MKEALLAKIESCIKLNTAASYEIEYSCIIPYNPPPPIKNRALASLRMACYYLCHARIQRGGGGGGPDKVAKPAFNVGPPTAR